MIDGLIWACLHSPGIGSALRVVADRVELTWSDGRRSTLSLPEFGGGQCP